MPDLLHVAQVAAGAFGLGMSLATAWAVMRLATGFSDWVRTAGWFERPARDHRSRLGDDLVEAGLLRDAPQLAWLLKTRLRRH